MPDNKESSKTATNSTVLKTVAGVALGAAFAFGAYLLGKSDGHDEAKHSYQERVSYAKNMTPKPTDIDDSDDKISRDCDICKRSFKHVIDLGEEIHSTPCGHIFCKGCIETTLRMYQRCPICNLEVARNETHRIFL